MEKITYFDQYSIEDILKNPNLVFKKNTDISIRGIITRMFKNGQLIDQNIENLVVANGRRFVAQKLFDVKHTNDVDLYTGYKVSYFGFGSGGSTIVDSTPVLNGPLVCDTDLYVPIQLVPGNHLYLTSPDSTDYVCKSIVTDGTIEVVENTNLTCDAPYNYTWVKCTCYKAIGEPSGLSAGESVKIDEAALYYANESTGDTQLFAHICFTPKWIEKEAEFYVEWYILC